MNIVEVIGVWFLTSLIVSLIGGKLVYVGNVTVEDPDRFNKYKAYSKIKRN